MTSPNLLKIYKCSKMYGWHAYAVNKILKYASQSKATDYWVLKCMLVLSHTQLFATPWTIALESPLSMGFPRQEYWSGLPFPPLGDLPNPAIKPVSPVSPALQVDSLHPEPSGRCIVKAVTDQIRRRRLYRALDLSRPCTLESPSGTYKIRTNN